MARRASKAELIARLSCAQSWNGKLNDEERTDMGLFVWMSFDWVKREPCKQAVMNIISTCNLTIILANRGYPADYSGEANRELAVVLTNLKNLIARSKKTGSWALNGELIRYLPAVLSLHDRQLAEVSRKVMEACVNYVRENV